MELRPTQIQTKPRRMRLKDELLLAVLPTVTVLLTLAWSRVLVDGSICCAQRWHPARF